MLSETAVSIFLEASITGAGLVLAVYALVSSVSERVFEKKAERIQSLIEEFEKEKKKITVDASTKDFKRLNDLRNEIKDIRLFPNYWSIGIVAAFSFFMVSALFSMFGLVSEIYRSDASEIWIVGTFVAALVFLFSVGISTIFEIYQVMHKEYEDIKEKQKEAKEYKIKET